MNKHPIRYAFRIDPATEAALEQIARHTFQSKASIMRRYVREGVKKSDCIVAASGGILSNANSIFMTQMTTI